jgi:hypothetical protein
MLVPLEEPGSGRGIWDGALAESVAAALSGEFSEYEFHICRVKFSNNASKAIAACYRNGAELKDGTNYSNMGVHEPAPAFIARLIVSLGT